MVVEREAEREATKAEWKKEGNDDEREINERQWNRELASSTGWENGVRGRDKERERERE